LSEAETTLFGHVEHNFSNLSTVECRVVAQLDSCYAVLRMGPLS
jgi:hypothetical protein